jgi:hypothetical protein
MTGHGPVARERDDEVLMQALGELLSHVDPCPQRVTEGAGSLFTWRVLEADLAALLSGRPFRSDGD